MGILDGVMSEMSKKEQEEKTTTAKEITDDVISNSLYAASKGEKKKALEIDGPISTIITHALNVVYGKKTVVKDKDDLTTMPSLEDHAIDAPVAAAFLYLLKHRQDENKQIYIYGVEEKNAVGGLDLISKKMKENEDKERMLYVASENGINNRRIVVDTWCRQNNIVICHSLESLIAEVERRVEIVNG